MLGNNGVDPRQDVDGTMSAIALATLSDVVRSAHDVPNAFNHNAFMLQSRGPDSNCIK